MNILLVAATAKEIAPFLLHYRKAKHWTDLDVLVTGVGLTASTYHLQKQISIRRPDLVLQAGVAGCFDEKLPLGSVVAVGRDVIADQAVIENERLVTLFDLGLIAEDQAPYSKGWLVNRSDILKKTRLPRVNAISVNEITTSGESIKLFRKAFKPVVESLEGAALHYVCLMEKISFMQLRAVSNYIGERDKKNWDLGKAIRNLNNEIIQLVNQLENPA